MGELSVDLDYPRVAKYGDIVELTLTTCSKEASYAIKKISVDVSSKLKDGSTWKQKNSYHGSFSKERTTAKIAIAVPYSLEHGTLHVELRLDYNARERSPIIKKVEILLLKSFEELIQPEIVTEKNEMEPQIDALNRRINQLESLYDNLSIQLQELRNMLQNLSDNRADRVIQKIAATIIPPRLELDKEIKSYIKSNFGSPLLIGFVALVMGVVLSKAQGNVNFANELAMYAYYSLMGGVALQIISIVKKRKNVYGHL